MMRLSRWIFSSLHALAFFLACACSSPYDAPPSRAGDPGDSMEEADTLFVSSTDPSTFDFETNDRAYIADEGYTLWALKAGPQSPFVSRRVVLDKLDGNLGAGYGIVFCHHATGSAASETMLVAMIDAQQEYIVGEAVGSNFKAIIPWTKSPHLKYGYDQANTISVSLDGDTRVFTLLLNDDDANPIRFSAIEADYDLRGGNGYIAVISPRDSFPNTPVHITYQER
jgi:hypothetical protein